MSDTFGRYRVPLENIEVVDFLEELGLRNVIDKGTEVFYSCPFPGHTHEDSHPSASMSTDGTTKAYCFGCGWSGNAVKFLADYENVSPLVAVKWLRQRFGDDFLEPEGTLLEEIDTILAGTKKREDEVEGILDEYEADRRALDWQRAYEAWKQGEEVPIPMLYMFERGFDAKTLDKYKIGYDSISQRIVIPYRNEEGKLVGFKARAFLKDHTPRYWVVGGVEYGFKSFNVSNHLFGLTESQQDTGLGMIVREGEFNCMVMNSAGWVSTVGISGSFLSDKQIDLIKEHATSSIVWFDRYTDTMNAAKKLAYVMPTWVVPETDFDPADMTPAELEAALSKSQRYLEAYLPSE